MKETKRARRSREELVLACREARMYLRDHPGLTREELYAALPGCAGTLRHLIVFGLVQHVGGGKAGPARWYLRAV